MSGWTLRVHPGVDGDLEVSALLPEQVASLGAEAVARLAVKADGRPVAAGELFRVSGREDDTLVFETEGARLHGIGAGMRGGRITVAGDAGDYVARDMAGGTLRILGNVGRYAGSRMGGGLLEVAGDAGEFLGAALPGQRHGLRGGTLLVHGNAGARAGDRMRRGLLLVEGDVDGWCGARMLAGTVAVLGRCGHGAGFGMRRGTLLLRHAPPSLESLFDDCGEHDLLFLTLLLRHLRRLPGRFAELPESQRRVRCFRGDQSVAGKGEVLVWRHGLPGG